MAMFALVGLTLKYILMKFLMERNKTCNAIRDLIIYIDEPII